MDPTSLVDQKNPTPDSPESSGSPSKRRRSTSTVSDFEGASFALSGLPNRMVTGTPAPCSTPTNSPEKFHDSGSPRQSRTNSQMAPGRSSASKHRNTALRRLRHTPNSPPTPYVQSPVRAQGPSVFEIPTLILSQLPVTDNLGLGMEERQRLLREENQRRIQAWESFYGDVKGEREGGKLCMSFEGLTLKPKADHEGVEGDEVENKGFETIPVKFS
ncbi:hypothetical protein DFH27DRAFT_303826 [Peziza echinospora]|nr:hypothetical protein DFH27DRAFT_303826 [Peziza echinospora]